MGMRVFSKSDKSVSARVLYGCVLASVFLLTMGTRTVFADAQDLGELKIDLQSGQAVLASETLYDDLTITLSGFTVNSTVAFMAGETGYIGDLDFNGMDDITISKNEASGNYEVNTTPECSITETLQLKTPDEIRQYFTKEGFDRYYSTLTFIFPKAPEDTTTDSTEKPQTPETPGGSASSPKSTSTAAKKANPMKVKAKTTVLKYKKLKTKKQTIAASKVVTVSKAKGKVTYKLVSVTKKSFQKYFSVQKKTGKITVKKGLKKGTYKLKIKVTAAGNAKYKSLSKTVTCKIQVR